MTMTIQDCNMATVRTKAMAAVRMCRENSPTLLGVRPYLYKKCLEGVFAFERLRPHVTTNGEPFRFRNVAGQKKGEALASAPLDKVLSVPLYPTPDHNWRYDIIIDIPAIAYGTPERNPGYKTREEAEKAALAGLALIGTKGVPADDYEPVADPDNVIRIILGDTGWSVPVCPPEG